MRQREEQKQRPACWVFMTICPGPAGCQPLGRMGSKWAQHKDGLPLICKRRAIRLEAGKGPRPSGVLNFPCRSVDFILGASRGVA